MQALERLSRTLDLLIQKGPAEEFFPSVCRSLVKASPFHAAWLHLYPDEKQLIRRKEPEDLIQDVIAFSREGELREWPEEARESLLRLELSPENREQLNRGDLVHYGELDSRFRPLLRLIPTPPHNSDPEGSYLLLPLLSGNRLQGILHLYSQDPIAFREEERRSLRQIGAILGLVRWMNRRGQETSFDICDLLEQNEELEQWVNDRTIKLARSNMSLKKEIEQHKDTYQQLRQSQTHLQAMMDHISQSFLLVDPTLKILTFNQAARRLPPLLLWREPEAGDYLMELLQDDLRELVHHHIVLALQNHSHETEQKCSSPDGEERWYHLRFSTVKDEESRPMGVTITAEEITARKKTEESLRQSEELLRAVFERSAVGIVVTDVEGHILRCNHSFLNLLGYNLLEVLGRTPRDITHPEDMPMNEKLYQELLERKRDFFSMEKRFLHKNGDYIWALLSVSLIYGETKKPLYRVGIVENINNRKQMEEELKRSEQKFRDLFEQHSAVMLLVDPADNGRIVDANRSALRYYGYKKEEILGLPISRINTLAPDETEKLIHFSFNQNENHFIFKHRLADGEERDVEVYSSPIQAEERTLLFSIIHDITDRVHYQNELRKLNETLEQRVLEETIKRRRKEQILLQQSKMAAMGEMIGAIAHQWRQPLNVIGILIQDLEEAFRTGELSRSYLQTTVQSSMEQIRHMSHTIDDFRNFFRPSREKEEFLIASAIEDIRSLVDMQFKNNDIRILMEIDPIKDAVVLGYPNEFKHVVLNILNNARDAIQRRRENPLAQDLKGEIRITGRQEDDKVIITIQDNGGGVPGTILDRIFEPYFTTKDPDRGTGIGLYMSKTIIENNMNGSLTCENGDGGATFTICIQTRKRN